MILLVNSTALGTAHFLVPMFRVGMQAVALCADISGASVICRVSRLGRIPKLIDLCGIVNRKMKDARKSYFSSQQPNDFLIKSEAF
ncbi:MAG: hypothetical protein GY749_06380 [Desulfobacteraceae bacterium]|nr:hypothetical protein [Desulfobacteraceae bacterium]